ncbi:MAG: hypothetical protein PHQ93_06165 [Sulfurimonas sp.]|uniref:hypothetical protein n=1 Tax=Sulfurimonas sp. TaxID=2022749 RepID=UPI002605FF3C|nr:hypothetical protein [Sulfurimonas sp.]MDD5400750.1 hypothetical protein [Sulfurimonas sp.]
MPIVTRTEKGTPLTHVELDNNFNELDNNLASLSSLTKKLVGSFTVPASGTTPIFKIPFTKVPDGKGIDFKFHFSYFFDGVYYEYDNVILLNDFYRISYGGSGTPTMTTTASSSVLSVSKVADGFEIRTNRTNDIPVTAHFQVEYIAPYAIFELA